MLAGDELILVFDDSNDAGDTPRNRVLDSATGTHIVFLDDDDEYVPGALETIRRFARANPGRIGIFRVNFGLWGPAWRDADRTLMGTATAMYVIPNLPGRVGRFGRVPGAAPGRLGDYRFIVETVALQGEPVWCEEVTQEIRPEKRRLQRVRSRVKLRTRIKGALGIDTPQPTRPVRSYPEAEEWAAERLPELRGRLVASGRPDG